jgi:hypothetical protein
MEALGCGEQKGRLGAHRGHWEAEDEKVGGLGPEGGRWVSM